MKVKAYRSAALKTVWAIGTSFVAGCLSTEAEIVHPSRDELFRQPDWNSKTREARLELHTA